MVPISRMLAESGQLADKSLSIMLNKVQTVNLSKSTTMCSQVIDSQSMHILYSSYSYHTLVIVLKYEETHILLMSIILSYSKRGAIVWGRLS